MANLDSTGIFEPPSASFDSTWVRNSLVTDLWYDIWEDPSGLVPYLVIFLSAGPVVECVRAFSHVDDWVSAFPMHLPSAIPGGEAVVRNFNLFEAEAAVELDHGVLKVSPMDASWAETPVFISEAKLSDFSCDSHVRATAIIGLNDHVGDEPFSVFIESINVLRSCVFEAIGSLEVIGEWVLRGAHWNSLVVDVYPFR